MSTAPLETTGLCKRLSRKTVLDHCDLTVPTGSVTGLLGSNGAGKTTLIRCLLGLAKADSGSIRTLAEDPWNLSAAAKARIGYVPQTPAHYSWMRVRDLITYVGAFYPTWDPDLAERLRGEWQIASDIHVTRLSPGEAQRLALVLALSHHPELLILDEPAASLDPIGRRQFLSAVIAAAGDGATVLFSTHLCADLERVADRVAVLKNGRITVQTGVDDLKEQVKRLRITASQPLPATLPIEGVLSRLDTQNGTLLTVRQHADRAARRLTDDYGATVAIDDLGLDEIAVELLR